LGFMAVAWWRLEWAMACTLFTVPFYLFPKTLYLQDLGLAQLLGRSDPISFSLVEFGTLACFAAWAGRRYLYPRHRGTETAFKMPLAYLGPPAALFAASLLSLLFSEHLRFSLREFRVVIFEPLIFYLMVVDTARSPGRASLLLNTFVALGLVVSVAALTHDLFTGAAETTGGVQRTLAIYNSPNALALFLGRVIPVAAALALWEMKRAGFRYRSPYLWVGGIMAVVLFFTYSRGAWLAVLTSLFFIAAISSRKWVIAGAAVLLVAFSVAVASPERALALSPVAQRLYIWQAALEMLREHPITGVGLDNFLYHYPSYMLPQAWREPQVSHPHNILLDFWLRLGILGVVAMTWAQVSFWRGAVRIYRRAKGWDRAVALALMASMVDFLVHGLVDNSFFLVDMAYIFWLSFGITAALDTQTASQRVEPIQDI
ncbi:MAG: rane protein of unknown function, partial [Dehalococcoidia bacterium]|nr:rane protein of unknown function [Dehalococcoidia bacterium]